jgi:hypothetical protein
MTDHNSAYQGISGEGQLWTNARSSGTLFVFRSHGHLKGIWSDGRIEDAEDFTNIAHGKEGWKRVYPAFQGEE